MSRVVSVWGCLESSSLRLIDWVWAQHSSSREEMPRSMDRICDSGLYLSFESSLGDKADSKNTPRFCQPAKCIDGLYCVLSPILGSMVGTEI